MEQTPPPAPTPEIAGPPLGVAEGASPEIIYSPPLPPGTEALPERVPISPLDAAIGAAEFKKGTKETSTEDLRGHLEEVSVDFAGTDPADVMLPSDAELCADFIARFGAKESKSKTKLKLEVARDTELDENGRVIVEKDEDGSVIIDGEKLWGKDARPRDKEPGKARDALAYLTDHVHHTPEAAVMTPVVDPKKQKPENQFGRRVKHKGLDAGTKRKPVKTKTIWEGEGFLLGEVTGSSLDGSVGYEKVYLCTDGKLRCTRTPGVFSDSYAIGVGTLPDNLELTQLEMKAPNNGGRKLVAPRLPDGAQVYSAVTGGKEIVRVRMPDGSVKEEEVWNPNLVVGAEPAEEQPVLRFKELAKKLAGFALQAK